MTPHRRSPRRPAPRRWTVALVATLLLGAAPALASVAWEPGVPSFDATGAEGPDTPPIDTAEGAPEALPEQSSPPPPAPPGAYAAPSREEGGPVPDPDAGEGIERLSPPLPEDLLENAEWLSLTVQVVGDDGAADAAATRDVEVLVHLMLPPHELVGTWRGRTDDEGLLALRVPSAPGLQVFAQVVGDRSFFSEAPVELGGSGPFRSEVRVQAAASDLAAVVVRDLTTIVEPWEGYLAVTQIWTLATEDGRTFRPADNDPRSAVRLSLLEGASALQVIEPDEGIERRDGFLLYRGPVLPEASDPRLMTRVILRYSLSTRNARTVDLRQPVAHPVRAGTLMVPLSTPFSRHPIVEVALEGPACADGGLPCFEAAVTHDPVGVLRDGVPVRGLTGLRAEAGSTVEVRTVGWPGPSHWERSLAVLLGLLGLAFGLSVLWRVRGLSRGGQAARLWQADALAAQRDEVLREAAALEAAWLDGELLETEVELAREQIREELAVILRRMRSLGATPPAEMPPAEDGGADGVASEPDRSAAASDG